MAIDKTNYDEALINKSMQTLLRLSILTTLTMFALVAYAQEGGPPMLVDDARVADYKEWELNSSINTSIANKLALSVPHIDLNYGIYPGLQLKVEAPFILNFNNGGKIETELGEVNAGAKYQFINEEKHFVSAAIFPQYSFNVNRGVLVPVFVEKTFNKFLVGTTIGYFWGDHKHKHSEYGAIAGYRPKENWNVMAEYYSTTNHGSTKGTNGYANVGFRWLFGDNFMVMGSFGTQVVTPKHIQREQFISWIGIKNLF